MMMMIDMIDSLKVGVASVLLFASVASWCFSLWNSDEGKNIKKIKNGYRPPSYPFLGCLISFYKNRHRLLDWYTELLSRSPTQTILIDRLGSVPTIITANPANVEHILKNKFHNYPKGKPFHDILGDLLGRGIFNVDGQLWYRQRKAAAHEFSTRSLRDYALGTIQMEANQRLLPLLQSASKTKTSVDLQEILNRFTIDTVCKVSFGMDPECLLPSMPTCELAYQFDVAAAISARRGTEPLQVIWKMKRALQIGSENRLRKAIDSVHRLVMERILAKKMTGNYGDDLLSRFLSISGGDEELVRDMMISFLMAGKDTTASALTWFFWLLAKHRGIQEEILKEVRAQGNGGGGGALDFQALREMKFLKACLCESMRLYPPVSWDSKHALHDDTLPDGTFVGKGSRVTYFPYGMGRMQSLWGKDCLDFKPERWLSKTTAQGSEDEEERVSPYKYPVFQAGPRQCLGKEMAFMEMKYIVVFVLTRFIIKPVEMHEPRFLPLLTARMAGGLPVLIEES